MFRSVISAGLSARRDGMLINAWWCRRAPGLRGAPRCAGGTKPIVASLALPLMWLLGGVLAAAIASGATYLAQRSWHRGRNRWGQIFNTAAVVLVVGSYLTFIVASKLGFDVLRNLPR